MSRAPRPEGLDRESTLRRRTDFVHCYERGRRISGRYATLHLIANPEGHLRLGVTASRKVGGSVVRHRLKRWIRETYRRSPRRGDFPAIDLVVHLRASAAAASYEEFRGELERQWTSLLTRSRG
ncbi:MAG: ribonuclease P protein component [Thermoanaerobaculia bacterium]